MSVSGEKKAPASEGGRYRGWRGHLKVAATGRMKKVSYAA